MFRCKDYEKQSWHTQGRTSKEKNVKLKAEQGQKIISKPTMWPMKLVETDTEEKALSKNCHRSRECYAQCRVCVAVSADEENRFCALTGKGCV